jgi:4-hydroxythreonine-4-phosphate dehydrogenase
MSSKRNRISASSNIRIGLTIGDPAGIGPEIAVKALAEAARLGRVVVIGGVDHCVRAGLTPQIARYAEFEHVVGVSAQRIRMGVVDKAAGAAALTYLERARKLLARGQIDCLVTCPISKEALARAGAGDIGHTEYLARHYRVAQPVMMLLNSRLKFALVTRHCALRSVSPHINAREMIAVITRTYEAMRVYYGISHPRVGVCGLNPHASDNGLIGDEETRLVVPLVRRLSHRFLGLCGPLPADIAVARHAEGEFDALVAMYHDQALIPLKLTDPKGGVNLTLGLPFVRTSPLHGTAFDIAGKGVASHASLLAAVRCAVECTSGLRKN